MKKNLRELIFRLFKCTKILFYNATTKQGICQEIDRLCDSDDTAYPRLDKTSRINQAYEEVVGWLINADGVWQFDDTNYTALPIATYTLTEGQTAYSIADKFLQIEEVDILTVGGTYKKIIPVDHTQFGLRKSLVSGVRSGVSEGISIEEFFGITSSNTPKGMPTHYDKWEDSIKLYPAPAAASVTLAAGMKIYYKRTAQLFTAVSTTAADSTEPGFASPWHKILAYMAALPYCAQFKKDRVPWLMQEIATMRFELIAHYGRRQKDVPSRMAAAQHNNK